MSERKDPPVRVVVPIDLVLDPRVAGALPLVAVKQEAKEFKEEKEVKVKKEFPDPPARPSTPQYYYGLYKLAEAMVGALGQGDIKAIWRRPEDDAHRDWTRFIDPKFQAFIYAALKDLAKVSRATIWQVADDDMARSHFLAYIQYEYSSTKLATKGTYRQLDAKNDLADGFRDAARFFRTWRPRKL